MCEETRRGLIEAALLSYGQLYAIPSPESGRLAQEAGVICLLAGCDSRSRTSCATPCSSLASPCHGLTKLPSEFRSNGEVEARVPLDFALCPHASAVAGDDAPHRRQANARPSNSVAPCKRWNGSKSLSTATQPPVLARPLVGAGARLVEAAPQPHGAGQITATGRVRHGALPAGIGTLRIERGFGAAYVFARSEWEHACMPLVVSPV